MRILDRPEFPTSYSLEAYVQLISGGGIRLISTNDSKSFAKFCNETIIVGEEKPPREMTHHVSHCSNVREVLSRLIEIDIIGPNSSKSRERNVLSLGYRTTRWHSFLEVKDSVGVECYFVNTLHSFFMSKHWELVLSKTGEEILLHTLSRPVLIPSGGSFIQVAGRPLPQLLYHYPSKTFHQGSLFSCALPRHKMFYNYYKCKPGLPRRHVLNKTSTTPRILALKMVRCISALCEGADDERMKILINEKERNTNATALEQVAGIILKNYKNCDFSYLLDCYCPLHDEQQRNQKVDNNSRTKKTRRGCRAGDKLKPRKKRALSRDPSEATNDDNSQTSQSQNEDTRLSTPGKAWSGGKLAIVFSSNVNGITSPFTAENRMQKRTTEKAVRREPPGEAVARKTITIKDTAANGETRNGKLRNSHQLMQNGINNFDMAIPCVQVVKFVQAACRGVFPLRSVWSSSRKDSTRRNYNAFMKRIEDFITLGRWESMNLTQLCKSMKTSMMPWLMHHNNGEEDNGHSTEGTLHLSIVLAWIFTDFLPHLLASCFYATEGEGTGGKVLYYRKQKWDVLRRRGEVEMMHHFTKIQGPCVDSNSQKSMSQSDGARTLPNFPCVRFVPKKQSMRAITNMKVKPTPKAGASLNGNHATLNGSQSIPYTLTNGALYNVLHILSHLQKTYDPTAFGFGVSGVEEACSRFKRFNIARRAMQVGVTESTSSPYYFAVLDLEKCFDNVNSNELYRILTKLVCDSTNENTTSSFADISFLGPHPPPRPRGTLPKDFLIHKYNALMFLSSAERFVSRSIRRVAGVSDLQPFLRSSEGLATSHENAVITDGVVYPSLTREELLKTLHQHLFQHAVRLPKSDGNSDDQLYTQSMGIPQGSALSPLLCNIYYGHAERETFGQAEELDKLGLRDGSSFIVRLMDDYMMVSTRQESVTHFLRRAHDGFEKYGGKFNPSKTRVNFDVELELGGNLQKLPQVDSTYVTWCGFDIDLKTLEVFPSFAKLFGRGIENSITRECCQSGVAFRKALKGFIRPKFHRIVFDSDINRFTTIVRSVYSLYLIAALRCDIYLRQGANALRLVLEKNVTFIFSSIRDVICYGAGLVSRRVRQSEKAPPARFFCGSTKLFALTKNQTKWLGFKAFHTICERCPSKYKKLLRMISVRLRDLKNKMAFIEHSILLELASTLRSCEHNAFHQ